MASLIPENEARFTLADVARITSGTLHGADLTCVGVTTDTRSDLRGRLFVALGGERFDGHAFAAEALKQGALGVLIERDVPGISGPFVKVSSTLAALGALAADHRARWNGRVVGVAGSAGKTTTRSAIAAVLDAVAPGETHYAAGNLNNLIGVPMVLLGLREEHALAVVEIGTNAPGEVRALSLMSAPDLAVLTLIGIEHSEGLGDLDGIEREEGEIWSGLAASGTALFNADDARVVRTVTRAAKGSALSYGLAENADYRLLSRESTAKGGSRLTVQRSSDFARDTLVFETPLLGNPGAYAALAALAVGEWAAKRALEPAELDTALGASGEPGRLTPIALADGTLVLDDSYNSNPASVASSLATALEIAKSRGSRLVLALGEMRELGALSLAQHAEVGEIVGQTGAALLIAIAGDARSFVAPAARAGIEALFVESSADALNALLPRLAPKDVLLVKASRGVRAEQLVRGLVEAIGRAA